MLLYMYQVFSSLLGHLHFFVHIFLTFMEYFFMDHPILFLLLLFIFFFISCCCISRCDISCCGICLFLQSQRIYLNATMDEYKEFAKNNHEYVDPKTGAKVTVQFFIGGKYD